MASQVAQGLRIHLLVQGVWETQARSLGWEDPLEKEMATHPSILAWEIPWTEGPGRLQSTGFQRVGHDGGPQHTLTGFVLLYSGQLLYTWPSLYTLAQLWGTWCVQERKEAGGVCTRCKGWCAHGSLLPIGRHLPKSQVSRVGAKDHAFALNEVWHHSLRGFNWKVGHGSRNSRERCVASRNLSSSQWLPDPDVHAQQNPLYYE